MTRHCVMPQVFILLLAALLGMVIALTREETSPAASPAVVPSSERPNIVLILTDDLDARSAEAMPAMKELLAEHGIRFTNAFASTPLCCPARVSILRGQYVHNHGILANGGPSGGFATFRRLGGEDSTIATWLQEAGYRTALVGKYLNGYPEEADSTYVPPGWDEWYALAGGSSDLYLDYELNENGAWVAYGSEPADYLTDVLSMKATDFVARAAAVDQPFFLYLAPYAPHDPAQPAPRHADAFADARAPRVPAFNEADVTDKPDWVRERALLTAEQVAALDAQYRNRLRSMLAVDELVAALVETLEATGIQEKTYIVFTSDNGFHLGEHRIPKGKETPYTEVVRVPLVVRGPDVPAGTAVNALALNVDLAPTLAELAGVSPPPFVDGRSLVPLLHGSIPTEWRRSVLLEHFGVIRGQRLGTPSATPAWRSVEEPVGALETPQATPAGRDAAAEPAGDDSVVFLPGPGAPPYRALRTVDLLYVEYAGEVRELYDLRADPQELENLAATVDPAFLAQLSGRLAELRECAGASCRVAEDAPLDESLGPVPLAPPTAERTTDGDIEVVLRDGRLREVGRARIVAMPDGKVTVHVDMGALHPGEHGIHVHEVGICDPSGAPRFASVGGHHNPTGATHGGPPPAPGHAGDLGNIVADQTGFAQLDLTTNRFGLAELRDANGSALVIHAARDDLTTDPEGLSGPRLVCGVLAPPQFVSQATPLAGTPESMSE